MFKMAVLERLTPQLNFLHPKAHRKLSETSGVCSPTALPKPCLKRRCSVPTRASASDLGSCESLSSSNSGSSSGLCGSFNSRKSVSFADSIGEDLCHIKLFEKDLQDEENFALWRWRERGFWMDDGDDECDLDDCDLGDEFDAEEEYFQYGVIAEEDEDVEDDDDCLSMSNFDIRNRFHVTKAAETSFQSNARGQIVPTFVSPQDLPDFQDRLSDRGLSLENASVISDGGQKRLVSGTIRTQDDQDPDSKVEVQFSFDNWRTVSTVSATTFVQGQRYGFVIDVSRMNVGDDLEITLNRESKDNKVVDDNNGLKYRFICKNEPKFKPGKSLW